MDLYTLRDTTRLRPPQNVSPRSIPYELGTERSNTTVHEERLWFNLRN